MNLKELLSDSKLPVRVLAYNRNSNSARALAARLRELGYDATVRASDPVTRKSVCIGWGMHNVQVQDGSTILNKRDNISVAANKRTTLEVLDYHGVCIPTFTSSSEEASQWLRDGSTVVCRHRLNAHSGTGIQIVNSDGDVYKCETVAAPWYSARLFTKYFKRAQEYRVYVVGGKCIFARRKGASTEIDPASRQYLVRTHATGWNFCEVELSDVPSRVLEQATVAVQALGLHFGAVDIGWNELKETACVFEVNTAPGMQGSTIDMFVDALLELDPSVRVERQRVTDEAVMRVQHSVVTVEEAIAAARVTARRWEVRGNVIPISFDEARSLFAAPSNLNEI